MHRSNRLFDSSRHAPVGVDPAPETSHGFTAFPSAAGVPARAVSPVSLAAVHGFGGGGVDMTKSSSRVPPRFDSDSFGFECTPRASSRARPRARDDADADADDARVLARVTNERLSTRARDGESTNESRHFSDLESFPLARARDARKTRGRRGNVRERVSHRARSRARDEGASASARVGEG